jgi:dTDP-4-dehydrorhamnose 3,5-epimerase
MRYRETAIPGAFLIEPEPREDARGFFARVWDRREMEERGLDSAVAQVSLSSNRLRGTLRGMHFQAAPDEETKIVRCIRGALQDVLLDLRPGSGAYLQWEAFELTAENQSALYIPKGVAHGFQTLADDTEVLYQISQFQAPGSARGVRWNDPAFGIRWPLPDPILSDRDREYPDFVR